MTFANGVNAFNGDFKLVSGVLSLDDRIRLDGGICENIGFSYSSSTFTVLGANGSSFSSSNPGYINLPSKTAGNQVKIKITANQDFIDSTGSSQISGNLFGYTAGIAAAVDCPFYLYAVLNDAENAIAFMISRYPNTRVSPVAAKIGMPSSAVADNQGSFFSMENITAADYESNPCLSLGSFRMRMNSSNDWAVQTLNITDGIGKYKQGFGIGIPTGQFGAASGKYFKDNGGTAPSLGGASTGYFIDPKNNRIYNYLNMDPAAPGSTGTGAVSATYASPFYFSDNRLIGYHRYVGAGAYYVGTAVTASGTNSITFPAFNDVSTSFLNNNSFAGTGYGMNFMTEFIMDFNA